MIVDQQDLSRVIGDVEMLDDRADVMKMRNDVLLPDVSRIDFHDIMNSVKYYLHVLKGCDQNDG